jgi:hypothetical protein
MQSSNRSCNAVQSFEKAGVHHASRRVNGVAAGGARAATSPVVGYLGDGSPESDAFRVTRVSSRRRRMPSMLAR